MLITMHAESSHQERESVLEQLRHAGYEAHVIDSSGPAVIGVNGRPIAAGLPDAFAGRPGVQTVELSTKPYMLTQRAARPAGTIVEVGGVRIGGAEPVVMAGPCVVEGADAQLEAAQAVAAAGATMLRGGAFKPRTSPYAFQGLGEEGLRILALARDLTGLPVVTEVMEPEQVELVARYADMLQIGSRNMPNFPLLRRAAAPGKPVLLKRGFSATIEEWLMAAEYVLAGGNDRRRAVRARHPQLRHGDALHARPQRGAAGQAADAPADHRRSQPRHGPARAGRSRWRWPASPPARMA